MIFRSLAFSLCLMTAYSVVQAADVTPKPAPAEKKEETDPIGAIKREDKTVIPPEQLHSDVTPTPAPADQRMASNSVGGHLFGAHASVGVPHPINVGLNYVMPNRLFSFEASAGSFSAKASDVDVTLGNSEIGVRYHPFAGSFFVGALLGNQNVKGKKTDSVTDTNTSTTYRVTAEIEVKSNYVTPEVGWMWGADDGGFFAMFEVGVQAPSGVQTSFSSDAPIQVRNQAEYLKLKKDVEDGGDKLGNTTLPHLALIKIGWLF